MSAAPAEEVDAQEVEAPVADTQIETHPQEADAAQDAEAEAVAQAEPAQANASTAEAAEGPTEQQSPEHRQLDEDPQEAQQRNEEQRQESSRQYDDTFEDNGPPARPFDDEGRPLKIYIGNLSGACKMFHLREKFAPFGSITNVELKTNIGCGFVQFTTAEAAEAACRAMDGIDLLDQKIRVEPQRAGGARGNKPDGARSSDGCFNCGSRGHWSKHCPNPPAGGGFRGGRGRGRGRGGYQPYESRHQHHGSGGGGYDAYPPRRPEYHDPYARDPYAAPPSRDHYGDPGAGRDPYYHDPYARDAYAQGPPPPRDPYARDPYARDPYARDAYPPPRPQGGDPYYREAPHGGGGGGGPPRDYYEPRDDGRQQYRRGGTPSDGQAYGRDAYAPQETGRRRSRSPNMRRPPPPVQQEEYDYRYAPPTANSADPYAAPDAYYGANTGAPGGGGYPDYERGRGRSRSPPGGAPGNGGYGYA